MLVAPVEGGGAVQVARSLAEVDGVLGRLRLVLVLVALGGSRSRRSWDGLVAAGR
jgi:hypothetical protein